MTDSTVLKRLSFPDGHIRDIAEPEIAVQFAGGGLNWFHRSGAGWCGCLDPETSQAAKALIAAQALNDEDLLAFLHGAMPDLHQAFAWDVQMRTIAVRREFYQRHVAERGGGSPQVPAA